MGNPGNAGGGVGNLMATHKINDMFPASS